MKIAEIQDWIEKNSEIGLDLESAAREIPKLHGKAINTRANEKGILKALEMELDKRKRDQWLFYSGKAEPQKYKDHPFDLKVLKGDLEMFISSDPSVNEIRSKMETQTIKIELLDEFIKALNGRSFLLSNIINWTKIQNGLV